MKTFRFLEWKVYKDSKKLFEEVLVLVNKMPKEYRYEVGSQLIRSSLSVALNISEGSGKHSDDDFNRFLNIALGSLHEVVAILDIARDTRLIENVKFEFLKEQADEISNQLGGFKKKLIKK